MNTLEIQNLHVSIDGKPILKGVDLIVRENEVHALMGPNGNGKSTLLAAIMGHPKYEVTEGKVGKRRSSGAPAKSKTEEAQGLRSKLESSSPLNRKRVR